MGAAAPKDSYFHTLVTSRPSNRCIVDNRAKKDCNGGPGRLGLRTAMKVDEWSRDGERGYWPDTRLEPSLEHLASADWGGRSSTSDIECVIKRGLQHQTLDSLGAKWIPLFMILKMVRRSRSRR